MDGETFDDLVKRLMQTRLSRVAALRGVLASAAVGLAGTTFTDETEAKRKGNADGKQQGQGKPKQTRASAGQVTICHCPPGNPEHCHTITVGENAAQQHLAKHEGDTRGPCTGRLFSCVCTDDTTPSACVANTACNFANVDSICTPLCAEHGDWFLAECDNTCDL